MSFVLQQKHTSPNFLVTVVPTGIVGSFVSFKSLQHGILYSLLSGLDAKALQSLSQPLKEHVPGGSSFPRTLTYKNIQQIKIWISVFSPPQLLNTF